MPCFILIYFAPEFTDPTQLDKEVELTTLLNPNYVKEVFQVLDSKRVYENCINDFIGSSVNRHHFL